MNPKAARTIADALTWVRVLSVLPITVAAWYQQSGWVLALYVAAAVTDLLDGLFARRAAPSKSDLDFDGIADLLLTAATVLWIWMLVPGFIARYWLPYIPLFVALECYMTFARWRYAALRVPHLRFGRFAMALFFFLLPVLLVWGDVPWFVHAVLMTGIASKFQLSAAIAKRIRAL